MAVSDINVLSTLQQISDNAPPPLPPLSEIDQKLFAAAASDDGALIASLIGQGANPNAQQPSTRTTVLMAACDIGNLSSVKALLATRSDNAKGKGKTEGVRLRERDVRGRTALMIAAEAGHLPVLQLLIASSEESDDPAKEGEEGERVDYVDEQDYEGRTALMLATRAPAKDMESVVNYLLSNEGGNAAVNMTDADGRTALMFAAERASDSLIDLFLSQPNIDVKAVATGGFTAAVTAAVHGNPELAKRLMVIQKKQEAEDEEAKRAGNMGMSKGKKAKAKKVVEVVVEAPASVGHASVKQTRTFKIVSQSFGSEDAGTPIERKAARIRSAIREARGVAELVAKDLGWGAGEVVAVEELTSKKDGTGTARVEDLEVAVTFAF